MFIIKMIYTPSVGVVDEYSTHSDRNMWHTHICMLNQPLTTRYRTLKRVRISVVIDIQTHLN